MKNSFIMPKVKDFRPLDQVVALDGIDAQTDMAIEEMSELIKEILKYRRASETVFLLSWDSLPKEKDSDPDKHGLYEKIGDVIITLSMLIRMYGGQEEIQRSIDQKIKRLQESLDNPSLW